MLYLLAQGFWFIIPAMFSNMAPVWAAKLPRLKKFDTPLDKGRTLRGKPLLGKNKTVRGMYAGIVFALVIGFVQWLLSNALPILNRLEFIPLDGIDYLLLSFLLGLGALVGDAVESFAKRQLDIAPGTSWAPLDQLDYVLGAFLFAAPVVVLSVSEYSAAGFIGVAIHFVSVFVGYKLGIRDAPI